MQTNYDRGMVKWMPFDSVVSGKKMVNDILSEKNKVKMPLLSDEQKNTLEKNIINSLYSQELINIEYFYNGQIYKISGKIKKIDFTYNKIYLNNNILLFDQIIKLL